MHDREKSPLLRAPSRRIASAALALALALAGAAALPAGARAADDGAPPAGPGATISPVIPEPPKALPPGPAPAPTTPTASPLGVPQEAPPPEPGPAPRPGAGNPAATPAPTAPLVPELPPQPAGQPVVPLSLKDAIIRALANNPDLEIQRLSVKFSRVGVDVPEGAFDPVLFMSGNLGQNRSPFVSSNPLSGLPPGLTTNLTDSDNLEAGMRFRTKIGTVIEVSYGVARTASVNRFSLSPAYSPAATIAVTQSLLKGLSPTYQTAAIELARNDARISEESFRDQVLALSLSVEEAYWTYVYTREALKVAELALASARQLLSISQQKFKVGNVPEIDVLIAESGVASRSDNVIVARNDILNARDNLFRIMLPQGGGRSLGAKDGGLEARRSTSKTWDVDLLPLDAPRIEEKPVDVEKALTVAFENRPDYLQLAIALQSSDINIDRAWNERLPRLDASGRYSQLGLGKSWGNALKVQTDDNFNEWQVGFDFEVPIFNTTPRAQYEQAEISKLQAQKRIESLEQAILFDVRTAARNLDAARDRVKATAVAVKLADRQLENETKRLEAGLSTSYDVQLSVQNQTTARTDALKASVDREIARARLERATATILERHGITFEAP